MMVLSMQIGKRGYLGFTYLGLMMVIAIAGIGMAGVGIVWHKEMQREREKELLFIGNALRNGIGSYYENSLGGVKQFPASLEDLIQDKRYPKTKRHFRNLYADPMSRNQPWGLVLQQGRIIGVYSTSQEKPIKTYGFSIGYEAFSEAAQYSDWRFVYTPGSLLPDLIITE